MMYNTLLATFNLLCLSLVNGYLELDSTHWLKKPTWLRSLIQTSNEWPLLVGYFLKRTVFSCRSV